MILVVIELNDKKVIYGAIPDGSTTMRKYCGEVVREVKKPLKIKMRRQLLGD